MVKKKKDFFIEKIKKKLYSHSFMEKNRFSENDFIRKRKLPFTSVVSFLLNSVKQTLQKELTHFIRLFSKYDNVSKSAFCQQRLKLKPDAFIELNDIIIEEFYTDNDYITWEEFRLLAIDGSCLELPRGAGLYEEFGGVYQEELVTPLAKISTCYDILNDLIIDSKISPYCTSEYVLALKHLEKCKSTDLLVFDRGYNAYWFFYYMILQKINFVIRVKQNFGTEIQEFWNSPEESKIIEITNFREKSKKALKTLNIEPKPFKIRLIKVILDTGEIEVLATNLLSEEKYPVKMFKDLYNKRWGIETNYDHLKNQVEIGNFTGKNSLAIKQDFYANMFISNLQSILIADTQEELDKKKQDNKYQYKINKNLSLGFMKDRIIHAFTQKDNTKILKELEELFLLEPSPIRKGRKYKRRINDQRKQKHYINKKRSL